MYSVTIGFDKKKKRFICSLIYIDAFNTMGLSVCLCRVKREKTLRSISRALALISNNIIMGIGVRGIQVHIMKIAFTC